MKKKINLINNERLNSKIVGTKACVSGAEDICYGNTHDFAECTTYAYDVCTKDHAGCFDGAHDTCVIDTTTCFGPGAEDNTY